MNHSIGICSHLKALKTVPASVSCIFILALLLFSGCSGENSPEDSVKRFLAEAETAVEEGHIRQVREYIADDYHDPAGRTKQELVNYLAYQVLGKRAIYLYTSVSSISFPEPDKAVAELLVAMTGAATFS